VRPSAPALIGLLLALAAPPLAAREGPAQAARVTVLSTMLADLDGVGEWGFSALVQVDGFRLLFDTGAREETVLRNAEELGVDLAGVTDVVLSHNHRDHTGGLLALRRALAARNPLALSRAHVATGIFLRRSFVGPRDFNGDMRALRWSYEATGATIVEHARPEPLAPGVWLTGPVARRYPERNWSKGSRIVTPEGAIEDTIPEDQSLVIELADQVLVVTGCAHAGIGNILAQAREMVPGKPVRALVGGLHLLDADEASLAWTAERMKEAGVRQLLGAHCTGLEAVYRLRALLGLERASAVVGAVGSSYSSTEGLSPLRLAR
jgi:7,8-dihydropterin-6-yl-methyl-4-(beta-D-ribofuranosyl)aminobenzene 5'-phosphate synthase